MFYKNVKLCTDGGFFTGFLYHPSEMKRGKNHWQKPVKKIVHDDEEVFLMPKDEVIASDMEEETAAVIEEEFDEETGELIVKEEQPADEYTTLRTEFDKAFDNAMKYKRKQRIPKITAYMSRYFTNVEALQSFMEQNLKRRYNSYRARMVRYERKVNLNDFNYFVTFTYDNKLQTEESFKKRLLKSLQKLASEKGWRYIAAWERGDKTHRLHLHALIFVPDGQMTGDLNTEKSYDFRERRVKTIHQNSYFKNKFGRNDFEDICTSEDKRQTMIYIKNYLTKSNERVIYSRGLPDTFRCDIDENDVMGFIGEYKDKVLLFKTFHVYRDGKDLGEIEEFKARYLYLSKIKPQVG